MYGPTPLLPRQGKLAILCPFLPIAYVSHLHPYWQARQLRSIAQPLQPRYQASPERQPPDDQDQWSAHQGRCPHPPHAQEACSGSPLRTPPQHEGVSIDRAERGAVQPVRRFTVIRQSHIVRVLDQIRQREDACERALKTPPSSASVAVAAWLKMICAPNKDNEPLRQLLAHNDQALELVRPVRLAIEPRRIVWRSYVLDPNGAIRHDYAHPSRTSDVSSRRLQTDNDFLELAVMFQAAHDWKQGFCLEASICWFDARIDAQIRLAESSFLR